MISLRGVWVLSLALVASGCAEGVESAASSSRHGLVAFRAAPPLPWYRTSTPCPAAGTLREQARGGLTLFACHTAGVAQGRFEWVDTRGRPLLTGTNRRGHPHGPITRWSDEGHRIERVTYRDGGVSGPRITWYRNGVMASRGTYADGQPHGDFLSYYPDGGRREVGAFEAGSPVGIWRYWRAGGRSDGVEEWRDGELTASTRAPSRPLGELAIDEGGFGPLHLGAYATLANLKRMFPGYSVRAAEHVDRGEAHGKFLVSSGGRPGFEVHPTPAGLIRSVWVVSSELAFPGGVKVGDPVGTVEQASSRLGQRLGGQVGCGPAWGESLAHYRVCVLAGAPSLEYWVDASPPPKRAGKVRIVAWRPTGRRPPWSY